ncbi:MULTISPECIES: hypothetical protein [Actinomadura]|uniref:Uncharacterized protein n=1 Tax=Actinomadura yumaensis TaxID=111807 RepID=A0ABW2CU58_9ACTN|nr:hypothetical protein [Actinomadura sp. J1-007]MWK39601.1 hypothetical protein [Actinomadura sp. J1-007]
MALNYYDAAYDDAAAQPDGFPPAGRHVSSGAATARPATSRTGRHARPGAPTARSATSGAWRHPAHGRHVRRLVTLARLATAGRVLAVCALMCAAVAAAATGMSKAAEREWLSLATSACTLAVLTAAAAAMLLRTIRPGR